MKECKVGEEFEYARVRLRVEKAGVFDCENCFFKEYRKRCYELPEIVGACTEIGRSDGISVKFVKVEEDGK